jgi:hypothetical protein
MLVTQKPMMDASVAKYLIPLKASNQALGEWRVTHDYLIWTECRRVDEAPLVLWERYKDGVIRIPDESSLLHIIRAGTPHHIERLFGYWRLCECDILWLRVQRDDLVHHAMVLGGSMDVDPKNEMLWVCPQCAATVKSADLPSQKQSPRDFWRCESAAVEEFNADAAQRTCRACGHTHPVGYAFRKLPAEEAQSGTWW